MLYIYIYIYISFFITWDIICMFYIFNITLTNWHLKHKLKILKTSLDNHMINLNMGLLSFPLEDKKLTTEVFDHTGYMWSAFYFKYCDWIIVFFIIILIISVKYTYFYSFLIIVWWCKRRSRSFDTDYGDLDDVTFKEGR